LPQELRKPQRLSISGILKDYVDNKSDRQWFALRVKSRCEKAVAAAARSKGFQEFLPLYKCRHRWSDRSKLIDEPLFPGYVFCRIHAEDRFSLLTIPRVMHLVGIGNTPAALDDEEISAIRGALRAQVAVEPWPFLEAGERVQLSSGPLVGLEGFLVEAERQHRLVLGLSILKQSIAVEIEHHWIASAARTTAPSVFL